MLLEPIPGTKPERYLVGGTVRKSPDILAAFLRMLSKQILPPNVCLDYAFVDDNVDPDSSRVLNTFGAAILPGDQVSGDFSDAPGVTHQWSSTAMVRVGQAKNRLIEKCLAEGYDGLWLVDADLLLSPRTFWSLYYSDAPVVCGVFWTRWQDTPDCVPLPQVWLRHPYELDGRGKDAPTFLHELIERGRVQVWGQGACTLYKSAVLRKGVNFSTVPDLPTDRMWVGEDRHLCTRAERLHVPMYADAWPDIYHVYHDHQRADMIAAEVALDAECPGPPQFGSLVSLHLKALEPVADHAGRPTHLDKQHVRGQLGRLPLVRDLEETVKGLQRGQSRIVSVQYPAWSISPFRGQKRLIEVTLVDWRPFSAPVNT